MIIADHSQNIDMETAGTLMFQAVQDLNIYIANHIHDAQFPLLREKLRFLARNTTGKTKTIIRGTLVYMTRWSRMRVWLRVTQIINNICDEHSFNTLEQENVLQFHRFTRTRDVIGYAAKNDANML